MTVEGSKSGDITRSAGGILWRTENNIRKLIVIRKKDSTEWVLPKGHLEKGETWQQAAIREVGEETKWKGVIISLAGAINYFVDNTPKTVIFYNMQYDGTPSEYEHDEKIENSRWLSVPKAVKLLTHDKEKQLLRDLDKMHNIKSAFGCWTRKKIKSSSYRRLKASIIPYQAYLENLRDNEQILSQHLGLDEQNDDSENPVHKNLDYDWYYAANELMDLAKVALEYCQVEIGWRFFYQAELFSIWGLNPHQLRQIAQSTLQEAGQKLSGWRKDTVLKILVRQGDLRPDLSFSHVYEARKILQEHHSNTHIKLNTARFQLIILLPISLLLIFINLYLLPRVADSIIYSNKTLLYSVVSLGAMSGSLGGIISISRKSSQEKIPQLILNSWITASRPLIGAISAFIVYFFLLSGMLNIGDLTIPKILATATASGFSEAILLNAFNTVKS